MFRGHNLENLGKLELAIAMTNNQNSEQSRKELAITQGSLLAWSATSKCTIISLLAKYQDQFHTANAKTKAEWQNNGRTKMR